MGGEKEKEQEKEGQTGRGGGEWEEVKKVGEEDEVEEEKFMGYQIKSFFQAYSSIQPSFANKHSIVLAIFPDLTNLHGWQGLTGCLQRGKLSNIKYTVLAHKWPE